jgi:ABC-type antimicrobial peptide transport system permease subunit
MSSLCAELMHVKAGDKVTIYSNFNKEKLEFTVSGIIDNGLISYILTNKSNVVKSYFSTVTSLLSSLDLEDEVLDIIKDSVSEGVFNEDLNDIYNIVLSKKALNDQYDSSDIINIFQKSSIEKQKDAKLKERTPIIYLVLVIGIAICIISLFTVVNVIIEDNQANISLLMVLGYTPKDINKMIINGNHILVPLGMAIGMPLAYLILRIYFARTVANNNMIMPVMMKFSTALIIMATIILTYVLTLFALKKKATMVSMTDSLKDNR